MKKYDFLPDDFFDLPLARRETLLAAAADEVKEETYHKPLAYEERTGLKDTLSEVSIELSNQQEDYDEVKRHWNEEVLKPLKERQKETIQQLKTGTTVITGKAYYIRDHDAGRVIKLAADGTEVETRPMRADERQTTTAGNIRNINQAQGE